MIHLNHFLFIPQKRREASSSSGCFILQSPRACGRILGIMKPLAERINFVEALLGADLPASYRSFLSRPFAQPTELLTISSCGSQFTVQEFLRLDGGPAYLQLDSTYALVHDALPPGMVPFATDIAGNFYCVVTGARDGRIVWWNHERKVGDNHVKEIAASFDDFMGSLTEFSGDE
jgi:hypothetical protein